MSLLSVSAQKQKWVPIVALVAMVVALGVLLKQCMPMSRMRKSAHNLNSMAGEIAAEEAAKLIGKGKVALVYLDFGSGESEPDRSRIRGFEREARAKGLSIIDREMLPTEENALVGHWPAMTAQQFQDVLVKFTGKADAVVIFAEIMFLSAAELNRLPAARPKVVAVSWGNIADKSLIDADVVQVNLISRSFMRAIPRKKVQQGDLREFFRLRYEVVTKENVIQSLQNPY